MSHTINNYYNNKYINTKDITKIISRLSHWIHKRIEVRSSLPVSSRVEVNYFTSSGTPVFNVLLCLTHIPTLGSALQLPEPCSTMRQSGPVMVTFSFVWNILLFRINFEYYYVVILIPYFFRVLRSLNNSVGIETGYGLGGRGSIPGRCKLYSSVPQCRDRFWGPTNLLSNYYRWLLPRG
jgi:hypothetical protein